MNLRDEIDAISEEAINLDAMFNKVLYSIATGDESQAETGARWLAYFGRKWIELVELTAQDITVFFTNRRRTNE